MAGIEVKGGTKAKAGRAKGKGTKAKGAKDKAGIGVKGGTKTKGKGKGKGKGQGQEQKGKGKSKGQGNFPRKNAKEDKDEQGGAMLIHVRTLAGQQTKLFCGKHDIVRKVKERMPIDYAEHHPLDIVLMKPVAYWETLSDAQITSGDIVFAVNQAVIEDKPVLVNGRLYLNQTLFLEKKEKETKVKETKEKQAEEQEIPRTPCIREECVNTRKRLHECLWGGPHYPALSMKRPRTIF